MVEIVSNFDGGNIRCVDAENPANIRLEILPDGKASFYQWFYFRVSDGAGEALALNITNASGASYADGWKDYRAVASYDRENWFRVDTSYDGAVLSITHTPKEDAVYYAYFAPYTTERHRNFIARQILSPLDNTSVLGRTLDGRSVEMIRVGEPGEGKRVFWVIARQHPGETMASWWMEGFLPRLLDENDELAASLREQAVFHVVPCMNLDGAARGHLRTNAAGVDLNRAWQNTTVEKSPEVFLVREKMRETGVDFFLDVHGDEAIPNNFLDAAHGIPRWNDQHEARFKAYSDALLDISADFQTEMGYPRPPAGKANLDIATNYVAETWDCLAMTLEMPFKDANVNPDPVAGWSPTRCRQLGRDNLAAMAKTIELLR